MSLIEGLVIAKGNLPDESGYYIIRIRDDENLPQLMEGLEYHRYQNYSVIYSGITKSLKNRERNHFKGSARSSTLRKSLGHILGYKKEALPGGKYRFIKADEDKLTNWMKNNLIMYFSTSESDLKEIENIMISEFNPPLNIDDNFNSANIEFRKLLFEMRKDN